MLDLEAPERCCRFWALAERLVQLPGVTRSTVMGLPCLRVDGAFFASSDHNTGTLFVKLSEPGVDLHDDTAWSYENPVSKIPKLAQLVSIRTTMPAVLVTVDGVPVAGPRPDGTWMNPSMHHERRAPRATDLDKQTK